MKRFFVLFCSTVFCLAVFAQQIDVQHYKYEIELWEETDGIKGRALISILLLANASKIQLDLTSPEKEKGMAIYRVVDNGKLLQTTHENNRLIIHLAYAAKKDDIRTIEVYYGGVPKDGLIISKNKYGERTFFADNWPNRAQNWLPCNDVPSDKASVEFIVTAPSKYKIISNGVLVHEKETADKKKITWWKEETPIPTKVMVIGAARFAVVRVDSLYSIPVTAWVYPQDSAKGAYDYALADDILRYFESYIGPYPYKKLANVQSKTIFGGMENASAIFYAENTVTGDRTSEALLAHEIVHQWFGNTATEKSFAHLWLSEGFATYLTDMYLEQKYGRDSFYKRLEDEKLQVIQFARRSNNPVVDTVSDYMDLLNANSYQKGGWVLHMLRNEVGDSIFKKIIQAYYQQYKFTNADTRDFQKIAEEVSGKKLKWFFNQWLYQPGIPNLKIKSKIEKGELKVTISQGKQLFNFVLEIAVAAPDGKIQTHRIPVHQQETKFTTKAKQKAQVTIDPEHKLLFSDK